MEKPAALAAIVGWAKEAAATKRPSSGTIATVGTAVIAEAGARGSSQGAATKVFFATRAIVQAAMKDSSERGGRHCSDFARMNAVAR